MIEDEALWQEFAAESEEHLDTIEAVLGGGGHADRPAVDRLFRAFHSLKGMSDALGAPGMKIVAHRCEDLLGLARTGRVQVAGPIAEGLLAAVDALRRQRATVLDTHKDAPATPALLLRLSALAGAEPEADLPQARPVPASPTAPAGALLGAFASRLAATSPLLAGLARRRDAAGLAEAAELAEAAALVGLHRLATLLRDLAATAGTPAFVPALGALRRAAGVLGELTSEESGTAALLAPAEMAPALLGARLAALAHLAEAAVQGAESDSAESAAADAALLAAAFGFDALERMLLLLGDLAARAAEPDGAEALATQAPHMAEVLRGVAEGGIDSYRNPPDTLTSADAADPRLPEAWLPLLGPDARRRTLAALESGQVLYRLRLASDAPAEAEAAVAEAVTAQGELLTSRTMLEAQRPHLDMLLAGPADAAGLHAALASADPGGGAVLDLTPLGAAAPAVAARTTPVTLRVRQDTVDEIIALEAEVRAAALAVAEALDEGGGTEALAALGSLARRLPGGQARDLAAGLERLAAVHTALSRAENRLAVGMRRLDEAVMELRVVPVGTLFARLPRVVRAVAQASGKEVDLLLEGEDVTIDRSLVELLADPLLHLTRNAVDHGIEPPEARQAAGKPVRAVLRVSARRRTGQVQVQVTDDGRGIDRDRVVARAVARGVITQAQGARMTTEEAKALLFRPGFSTAETVTETSGRGVGLDVVQDAARRAGGSVEIDSELGQGTTFTLRLPLTAAVQPVLLVEVGGHAYALPAARVDAVLEGDAAPGCDVLRLADLLGLPDSGAGRRGGIVLLKSGGRTFGLLVDRVQRRTDLLLRPLHPALAGLPGIGGVGVLGNGDPVIVLEPDGIAPAGH